jgi:hypothetical protein
VIVFVIENIAKIFALDFNAILKCPLILEVLALIVLMKLEISLDASSNSCRNKDVAREKFVLLNLAPPAAMPVEFVAVE